MSTKDELPPSAEAPRPVPPQESEKPAPEPAGEGGAPAAATEGTPPAAEHPGGPAPAGPIPDSNKPFVSGERAGSRAETTAMPPREAEEADAPAKEIAEAPEAEARHVSLEERFIDFLEALGPLNSQAERARRALIADLRRAMEFAA